MPITITATFECADITEYDEVMSLVRDNEPITIEVHGLVAFDDNYPDDDQTPPFGIERTMNDRSEAFAKAAEAMNEPEVHEWTELADEASQYPEPPL